MADEDMIENPSSNIDILEEAASVAGEHNAKLLEKRRTPHVPDVAECEEILDRLEILRANIVREFDDRNVEIVGKQKVDGKPLFGGDLDVSVDLDPLSKGTVHLDFEGPVDFDGDPRKIVNEKFILDPDRTFTGDIVERRPFQKPATQHHSISSMLKSSVSRTTPWAVDRAIFLAQGYLDSLK